MIIQIYANLAIPVVTKRESQPYQALYNTPLANSDVKNTFSFQIIGLNGKLERGRSGLSFWLLCHLLSNLGQGTQSLKKLYLLSISNHAASLLRSFQGSGVKHTNTAQRLLCTGSGQLPALG